MDGGDLILAKIAAWRKAVHEGAADGLGIAARNVLDVSNESVPHESGDLERDGISAVDRKKLVAGVGYGRRADRRIVAVVQHEDETLNHDAGRNDHFLSEALASEKDKTMPMVRAAIAKRIRGR